MQLLISDVATLPSLLEAIDDLGGLPSETAISEAQRLKCALLEVHKRLYKWKTLHKMDATCPWFPNITAANVHTHALTFEIMCLTEIEKVETFLADHGSTLRSAASHVQETDHSDRKACELADKICQSVEYFLQEEMRLFGPASAVFPLRIAYGVLSRDSQGNHGNLRRCQELIGRIRQTGISAIPHFPARLAEL